MHSRQLFMLLALLCCTHTHVRAQWGDEIKESITSVEETPIDFSSLDVRIDAPSYDEWSITTNSAEVAARHISHNLIARGVREPEANHIAEWASGSKNFESKSFEFKYVDAIGSMLVKYVHCTRTDNTPGLVSVTTSVSSAAGTCIVRAERKVHWRRDIREDTGIWEPPFIGKWRRRTEYYDVIEPRALNNSELDALMRHMSSKLFEAIKRKREEKKPDPKPLKVPSIEQFKSKLQSLGNRNSGEVQAYYSEVCLTHVINMIAFKDMEESGRESRLQLDKTYLSFLLDYNLISKNTFDAGNDEAERIHKEKQKLCLSVPFLQAIPKPEVNQFRIKLHHLTTDKQTGRAMQANSLKEYYNQACVACKGDFERRHHIDKAYLLFLVEKGFISKASYEEGKVEADRILSQGRDRCLNVPYMLSMGVSDVAGELM